MSQSLTVNGDCMEFLAGCEDKAFDLAIVDPPFGVQYSRGKHGFGVNNHRPNREETKWDSEPPSLAYFTELQRASVNQIIWGGNYFTDKLSVSKCWVIWDKVGETKCQNPFADCEMAWTSFNKVVQKFTLRQIGFISDTKDDGRIHPTQKPSELYCWLLQNYAKPGQTILDTHLGSGSSRIAAYDLGFDFTGIELDKDYFDAQEKRFAEHIAQPNFLQEMPVVEQPQMFAATV